MTTISATNSHWSNSNRAAVNDRTAEKHPGWTRWSRDWIGLKHKYVWSFLQTGQPYSYNNNSHHQCLLINSFLYLLEIRILHLWLISLQIQREALKALTNIVDVNADYIQLVVDFNLVPRMFNLLASEEVGCQVNHSEFIVMSCLLVIALCLKTCFMKHHETFTLQCLIRNDAIAIPQSIYQSFV